MPQDSTARISHHGLFLPNPRVGWVVATLACALAPLPSVTADWTAQIAAEPTFYAGPRGTEPTQQAMGLLQVQRNKAEKGFFFSAHLQAEALGSRGVNVDLDRVGYHSKESWGEVTLGRMHPWETRALGTLPSGMPLENPSYSPWSLHGQTQAQNLGLELGFPDLTSPTSISAFRAPILAGWLGAHVWVPQGPSIPIEFSASASPLFIPTLGSQVRFSESAAAQTGRFGRSPPSSVVMGDALLPLYYRINTENLINAVLLQPQFMIQARVESTSAAQAGWLEKARWVSHFWISRAPQPDPTADATGTLRVSESDISAIAEVTPSFPPRWTFGLSETVALPHWQLQIHLDMNAAVSPDGTALPPGAQLGFATQQFGLDWSLSYLHRLPSSVSTQSSSVSTTTETRFEKSLVQAEVRKAFSERWHASVGTQAQLASQPNLWLAASLSFHPIASPFRVQLSGDLFGGQAGTYFGEWRTNDRVAVVASYALD